MNAAKVGHLTVGHLSWKITCVCDVRECKNGFQFARTKVQTILRDRHSTAQVNVVKGCVSAVLVYATFD